MPRYAPSWSALVAALALACGKGESSEPPVPADLATFDRAAVERIQQALAKVRSEGTRAQAWADLAMVYSSERQRSLAAQCFATAERLEPRQPKWPYDRSIALYQNGELESAITAMERSLELGPDYVPSHARLGQYLLDRGDLAGAEREFRDAITRDATYPGGRLGLARVALQSDREAEAIALLEELAREDPDDRTFRQLLAVAKRQAGGDAAAPADVLADEDLQVWNDPWALETLSYRREPAMIQVSRKLDGGDAAGALAVLDAERARGASIEATGLLYANALRDLGRADDAMRELEPVLAREPENTQALMLQAHLLDDRGDLVGAVAVLDRVCALQPSFGGVFAAKARTLAKLGRHEPAVDAYRRALELGISDPDLRAALGGSLVLLKRWPEAGEVFAALVAEHPDDGNLWLQLAQSRLRSARLDDAEAALAKAIAAGNASPKLLENVASAVHATRERRTRKTGEQQ